MWESSDGFVAAMEMVEGHKHNQPKIGTKRIKFKKDVGEDRVSALPDCLLVEVLSRLTSTKEAIRSGTLSKRWKHLWTSVPSLIFCAHNYRSNILSLVCKTLNQCRQLKLKKFVVSSSYNTRFESQVNSIIHFAITRKVEELNLNLRKVELNLDLRKVGVTLGFPLDHFFFINSCLTDLRLSGCVLNPPGAICWKNLTSLCISCGKLDEDLIANILAGSPVLETLELNGCYGYRLLNITSKSVKNLVFGVYFRVLPDGEHDDFAHIIKINAPNILSLTIHGGLLLWKLLLVNVSSLIEANLNYKLHGHYKRTDGRMFLIQETTPKEEEDMLEELLLNLCHVKQLKTGICCSEVVSRLEAKGFDFPSNMIRWEVLINA